MMRATPFRYLAPKSLGEATAQLHAQGDSAMLLAGGTDLVPNMKRRQQTPRTLISLRQVRELHALEIDDKFLRIGAAVTLGTLTESATVRRHHALFRAAAQVATPPIRNMATIGGNLCLDTRCNYYNQNHEWRRAIDFCMKAPHGEAIERSEGKQEGVCWVAPGSPRCWAVSSNDSAPALIALDARIRLSSNLGMREAPLADLYADDGMSFLTKRRTEILTEILVPIRPEVRSTYWKLRRRGAFDFPVLGVGAALELDRNVVKAARIVLGAVASRPIVLDTSSLIGANLSDEAIDAFADRTMKSAKPLDNTDFQLGWRKRVTRAYLTGALKELRGDDPATLSLIGRRASALLPI